MEGIQEDESNTVEVRVDGAMTKVEVVTKIIQKVEQLEN